MRAFGLAEVALEVLVEPDAVGILEITVRLRRCGRTVAERHEHRLRDAVELNALVHAVCLVCLVAAGLLRFRPDIPWSSSRELRSTAAEF